MTPKTSVANSIQNLNQIIQPIIGETCHQVRFSYGDELRLHFGEMKPYNHPKLKHLRKGSWRLNTRATPWYLMHNNMFLFLPAPELTTDHAQIILQDLENKKLTNFVIDPNNFELTLSFEKGYELVLKPDLEDDSGLAYWELIMPNEQILIVGPGMFWECKSIHESA
ncbi:hypothetical protein [Sphaerospermopsis torques-reginae]|uniref:Uncharacterized protein n=1 Tax=Sphaerospermopsis torques-reginae ITEP-024 TaxID=984208 RepID=A0ABX8X2P9_9CYAN|nr:hypothetical protein [Sphaerospermopsis torques-reginae]QYX32746.1 hypothetical protein K2F26_05105 [Sphaerospermopsis torques-reginae ITEP-024]